MSVSLIHLCDRPTHSSPIRWWWNIAGTIATHFEWGSHRRATSFLGLFAFTGHLTGFSVAGLYRQKFFLALVYLELSNPLVIYEAGFFSSLFFLIRANRQNGIEEGITLLFLTFSPQSTKPCSPRFVCVYGFCLSTAHMDIFRVCRLFIWLTGFEMVRHSPETFAFYNLYKRAWEHFISGSEPLYPIQTINGERYEAIICWDSTQNIPERCVSQTDGMAMAGNKNIKEKRAYWEDLGVLTWLTYITIFENQCYLNIYESDDSVFREILHQIHI